MSWRELLLWWSLIASLIFVSTWVVLLFAH